MVLAGSPRSPRRLSRPPRRRAGDGIDPPRGWPRTVLLGARDPEHGAAALRREAPLGLRYHYLSGGANTGQGWQTFADGNGSFVPAYVADSRASGMLTTFSYYMLLQSAPGNAEPDERRRTVVNLASLPTMAAWFADLRTFFQRAGATGSSRSCCTSSPTRGATCSAAPATTTRAPCRRRWRRPACPSSRGCPTTSAGVARAIVRLRDRYARNVELGYHVSVWGTGEDISFSDPPDERGRRARRAHGARSTAASARSSTSCSSSSPTATRATASTSTGAGRAGWWDIEDFRRNQRYIGRVTSALRLPGALWQIPQGNTRMRAMDNTRGHYQDNRVQTLLDPSRTELRRYRDAGIVALLFGHAVPGATCACDATGDGVTNPAPIDGNDGGVAERGRRRRPVQGARAQYAAVGRAAGDERAAAAHPSRRSSMSALAARVAAGACASRPRSRARRRAARRSSSRSGGRGNARRPPPASHVRVAALHGRPAALVRVRVARPAGTPTGRLRGRRAGRGQARRRAAHDPALTASPHRRQEFCAGSGSLTFQREASSTRPVPPPGVAQLDEPVVRQRHDIRRVEQRELGDVRAFPGRQREPRQGPAARARAGARPPVAGRSAAARSRDPGPASQRSRPPARRPRRSTPATSPRAIGPTCPAPWLVNVAETLQRAPAGSSKSQLHDSRTSVGARPTPNVPAAGRPSPTTPGEAPVRALLGRRELVHALVEVRAGELRHLRLAQRALAAALPVAERPQHHRDVARAVGREDAQPLGVGPAHELALADPRQREAGAVGALPAPACPAHRRPAARRLPAWRRGWRRLRRRRRERVARRGGVRGQVDRAGDGAACALALHRRGDEQPVAAGCQPLARRELDPSPLAERRGAVALGDRLAARVEHADAQVRDRRARRCGEASPRSARRPRRHRRRSGATGRSLRSSVTARRARALRGAADAAARHDDADRARPRAAPEREPHGRAAGERARRVPVRERPPVALERDAQVAHARAGDRAHDAEALERCGRCGSAGERPPAGGERTRRPPPRRRRRSRRRRRRRRSSPRRLHPRAPSRARRGAPRQAASATATASTSAARLTGTSSSPARASGRTSAAARRSSPSTTTV